MVEPKIPTPRNYRVSPLTEQEVREIHAYYLANQDVVIQTLCDLGGFCKYSIKEKCKSLGLNFRTKKEALILRGLRSRGPNDSKWKGGKHKNSAGYVQMAHPTQVLPNGNTRWVLEHRLVWENAHGQLPQGWHVHHVNGIKTDNRLENLEALPTAEHMNYIPLLKRKVFEMEQRLLEVRQVNDNGAVDY